MENSSQIRNSMNEITWTSLGDIHGVLCSSGTYVSDLPPSQFFETINILNYFLDKSFIYYLEKKLVKLRLNILRSFYFQTAAVIVDLKRM